MTRVRPFPALRFARSDLSSVIVPPYDVITPAERAAFYDRDPHNAIRLELTRDLEDERDTDYAEIPRTLAAWKRDGVLVRDAEPALYALRQAFPGPDGREHVRDGFFCALHLEDYERRIVRPHERTLAGPKADRLKHLRAAHANLSAVFLLYEDRDQTLAPDVGAALDGSLIAEAKDDAGTHQRLAAIRGEAVDRVRDFLSDRPLVIADGHHRYETALSYRDQCRAEGAGEDGPHEWLLVYLANAFAPGSLLLPIHRLVLEGRPPTDDDWRAKLPGWKETRLPVADADQVPRLLAEHLEPLADRHAFAADDASGTLRIFSREAGDGLTIRALHRDVIEGVFALDEARVAAGAIAYPKSALETARELRAGRGAVALYVNPLVPDDVFRVTAAGDVLPQKSTFFFPKLPSGLVFRELV